MLWRIPFMHYLKKAEREAVQLSDLNLTLTSQDADLLQLHYASDKFAKIKTLGCFESMPASGNINNSFNLSFSRLNNETNLNFAITGSLCSHQTEVSLKPFLINSYPDLLKTLPTHRLSIAGRNPSRKLKMICSKYCGISIIANPADMQSIIDHSDIYICPINVGGGLKLRVMDALKAGLPVLAHAVSSRGHDAFKKAGFLFEYEDEQSFLESLKLLLTSRCEGRLEREKIKRLYASIFSYESGVNRLKELLINFKLTEE